MIRISYRIWCDEMAHPVVTTFHTHAEGLHRALCALQFEDFRASRAITAAWYTVDGGKTIRII